MTNGNNNGKVLKHRHYLIDRYVVREANTLKRQVNMLAGVAYLTHNLRTGNPSRPKDGEYLTLLLKEGVKNKPEYKPVLEFLVMRLYAIEKKAEIQHQAFDPKYKKPFVLDEYMNSVQHALAR